VGFHASLEGEFTQYEEGSKGDCRRGGSGGRGYRGRRVARLRREKEEEKGKEVGEHRREMFDGLDKYVQP